MPGLHGNRWAGGKQCTLIKAFRTPPSQMAPPSQRGPACRRQGAACRGLRAWFSYCRCASGQGREKRV
jgi:hypothetical protein